MSDLLKPDEMDKLKHGLPQASRELGESAVTLCVYLSLLGVVVYMFSSFSRIWVLLVPPLCGSFLGSLFLTLRPLNPYENFFSRLEGISGNTVKENDRAQTFIALLRSRDAKKFTLRSAFIAAPILCGGTVLIARLRHAVTLSFDRFQDPAWILIGMFFFWALWMTVTAQLLLRWALARLTNGNR